MEQTFEREEIFYDDEATLQIFNTSEFYIEEVRSILLGRCYMVCPLLPQALGDKIKIPFKKANDLIGNHV